MSALTLKNIPLYQQVADILTQRIASGEWEPGMVLPSEPKLAENLGVSPGTVRKALDKMAEKKLVTRRQGFGTLVSSLDCRNSLFRFFRLIDGNNNRIMPEAVECYRNERTATTVESTLFQLPSTQKVLEIMRKRQIGGKTMMLDIVTLPLPLFAKITHPETLLPDTLYDFYEAECGITVLKVSEKLTAVTPSSKEAEHLAVTQKTPLLQIQRTAYSFNEAIVELRTSLLETTQIAYLSDLS